MNNFKNEVKMKQKFNGEVVIEVEGIIGVPKEDQGRGGCVSTYDGLREMLDLVKDVDAKLIRVNVRSKGGSVEDALLMYEALRSLEVRVETVCYGNVASAATIIAQAGDVRKVSKDVLYLVHRATMAVDGDSTEVFRASSLLGKTDERVACIYADRSGLPVEEFRELMSRDSGRGEWLMSEEVVAAGLADEVVEVSYFSRWGKRVKKMFSPGSDVQNFKKGGDLDQEKVLVMSEKQRMVEASKTLPKEDAIPGEAAVGQSLNRRAYDSDMEEFRSML